MSGCGDIIDLTFGIKFFKADLQSASKRNKIIIIAIYHYGTNTFTTNAIIDKTSTKDEVPDDPLLRYSSDDHVMPQ